MLARKAVRTVPITRRRVTWAFVKPEESIAMILPMFRSCRVLVCGKEKKLFCQVSFEVEDLTSALSRRTRLHVFDPNPEPVHDSFYKYE